MYAQRPSGTAQISMTWQFDAFVQQASRYTTKPTAPDTTFITKSVVVSMKES